MGDGSDVVVPPEFISPSQGYDPATNAPDPGPVIISGSSPLSVVWNAATGTLSPAQVNNLKVQESAQLVQAGMAPAQAAATAQQDVDDSLSTFVGEGAFGTYTGALPSQASTGLLNSFFGPSILDSIPSWAWWIGGAFAGIWVLREFKIIK